MACWVPLAQTKSRLVDDGLACAVQAHASLLWPAQNCSLQQHDTQSRIGLDGHHLVENPGTQTEKTITGSAVAIRVTGFEVIRSSLTRLEI